MNNEENPELASRQFEAPPSFQPPDHAPTASPLETDECFAGVSSHVDALRNFVRDQGVERRPAILIGERGLRHAQIAFAIHLMSGQSPNQFYAVVARDHSEATLNELLASPSGLIGGRHDGTIFIDDITSLPNPLQRRLAIYINERRVDAQAGEAPEARLIFAALYDAGGAGVDNSLFHRLIATDYPTRFHIKPLRERREDIAHIVARALERIAERDAKGSLIISTEAMEAMTEYEWERNIEELESVLESALAKIKPLQIIPDRLPSRIRQASFQELPNEGIDLPQVVDDYERALVAGALRQAGGIQTVAAKVLRLHKQTLNMKLSRWREPE
jgi:DNA-binding NtrC family response regulator